MRSFKGEAFFKVGLYPVMIAQSSIDIKTLLLERKSFTFNSEKNVDVDGFINIFCCASFLKYLLNLLQYCFCLCFWSFQPWGMWDLSSPTKDQTHIPCIERWRHNHWTTKEVPRSGWFLNILLGLISGSWQGQDNITVKNKHLEKKKIPPVSKGDVAG